VFGVRSSPVKPGDRLGTNGYLFLFTADACIRSCRALSRDEGSKHGLLFSKIRTVCQAQDERVSYFSSPSISIVFGQDMGCHCEPPSFGGVAIPSFFQRIASVVSLPRNDVPEGDRFVAESTLSLPKDSLAMTRLKRIT
jgi:hypothetical protein